MTNLTSTTKRIIGWGLTGILTASILFAGLTLATHTVQATDTAPLATAQSSAAAAQGACLTAGATPASCPPTGIKESLEVVGDKIVGPAFRVALIQMLLNLSQFVLDRLAYEAAVAIASGGVGETSLFYNQTPSEAFKQLGLEVAGEAVGALTELNARELGIEFDLCDPGAALQFALALGIKQKYQPTAPKCDILEVIDNWDSWTANIAQTLSDPDAMREAVLSKFAESLKPGRNELSASLRFNIAIDQKVHEAKWTQFLERNESEYKDILDVITGTVETPSETLQDRFEHQLKEANGDASRINVGDLMGAGEMIGGLALTTAGTFTNTLVATTIQRIYTGLFETELPPNPFDVEAIGAGDRESAEERFSSIISPSPIVNQEFNVLSEFVVCPVGGGINRGLYNCVFDANFMAAVARGTGSSGEAALTVQEAIDEGLLNGDWALIPPSDEASNQDPFCYTYGYCYGNLVKMRNARIIPVGWELAALRNTGTTRATLQEIVDGFDDCTEDGAIGPASASNNESRWCHLIDPNWVLKYPETQCRSLVNGEIRISQLVPGRNSVCVDAPSCIGEDNNGNCTDGYGYCVQEENVWRFRGDECDEDFATCLSVTNAETGDQDAFLVNTVDYSVCGQDNAGCYWYRTNKYFDDGGTDEDTTDDGYEWLADGDTYTTADRDDDWLYDSGSGASTRGEYSYLSSSGETYEYERYGYEDRAYFTHDVEECDEDGVGCTQLFEFADNLYLNSVINPSFEEDEDLDGIPDGWIQNNTTYNISADQAYDGTYSVAFEAGSGFIQLEQRFAVTPNQFYTFSAYVQPVVDEEAPIIRIVQLDINGDSVSASGTSSLGDCTYNSTREWYQIDDSQTDFSAGEFTRTDCTFTVVEDAVSVRVLVGNSSSISSDIVYVDAIQLEVGEDVNFFVEGYSRNAQVAYYKVAPDYLGCTGAATDPDECDSYAQVCSAQDVGCNLYSPEDGDPSVPAIISELDECPSECVGYTTYKQEATDYESEDFPLYFIADSATECSEQYVGCDAYTNLGEVAEGGEDVEYFTDLRYCLSEDIADGSDADKTPATYFTWEGSDNEGYQLVTWYLLESNYTGTRDTFRESGFQETDPGAGPCTTTSMSAENVVVCDDSSSNMKAKVWTNDECDAYEDIFTNPDCREFYDADGNVHYRQYSDTISIDAACTPYRKDEGNQTDCEASGGYWTDQGFCRYYVLAEESTTCPAEQNGCRSYTGGAGRNATTVLSDTFETGTYDNFVAYNDFGTATLLISNESVASDGQSLYVQATSDIAGFETEQIYLDTSDLDAVYDADDSSSCTGTETDAGCEVSVSSPSESCVIVDGEESCGTLTDSLVAGKTFVVDFWAKGSGDLYVAFAEQGGVSTGTLDGYDMVDGTDLDFSGTSSSAYGSAGTISLDGSWQLYSLGPFDTSEYSDFDENAVLRFATDAGSEFYIDNITLKQVEENITVIKDSWVVPATCDQTPDGVESDQYFLGCEAYVDQNGDDANLYQFTQLCEEEVVGCEGFYDTANSESAYQQVFNARCAFSSDTDFSDEEEPGSSVACVVDDVEYCTIAAGQTYCNFDVEQVFSDPLPMSAATDITGYFGIIYAPETRVVRGDTPVYIVAADAYECESADMGCYEFGRPSFNQDQSEVESFESVYLIDLPASYDDILCDHGALFCEEWETTQDGNLYFKDPLDKTCEYKTGVTIDNQAFSGWFKEGTSEPCYWTDTDGDGEMNILNDDVYLINGTNFGVWRNGDDQYGEWIASCDDKYDLCTEFIDPVDTEAGREGDGTSYYFVNDDALSEDNLVDSQRCNGTVSQKKGCALFNNTTDSEPLYNAAASYVTSKYADVFYGGSPNDLVDPVSCTDYEDGAFTISDADASAYSVVDGDGNTQTEVNLCTRRCNYRLSDGDQLTTADADQYHDGFSFDRFLERSCLVDDDCPVLATVNGDEVEGTCANIEDISGSFIRASERSDYYLTDDTNEIIKVNRDRECSAWLACRTSTSAWNEQTGRYENICENIDLCVSASSTSTGTSSCTEFTPRDPIILSDRTYSERNTNWDGVDYSGMSIPYQLPVEHYDQFEVTPTKACYGASNFGDPIENDNGYHQACSVPEDCGTNTSTSCSSDDECGSGSCDSSGVCHNFCTSLPDDETEYRLVYNAGTCDASEDTGVGRGGECLIGYCEDSGNACGDSDDCGTAENCIVGYCLAIGTTGSNCNLDDDLECQCTSNDDCSGTTNSFGTATEVCDTRQNKCVYSALDDEENRVGCTGGSYSCMAQDVAGGTCIQTSDIYTGACFNDRCLTDIRDADFDAYNNPDPLVIDNAREMQCRGYPEVDSPHGPEVVYQWQTADDNGRLDLDTSTSSLSYNSEPYSYVGGYNDATVCAVDTLGNVVDCDCSYDRVEYANGSLVKYVELDAVYGGTQVKTRLCVGGPLQGRICSSDDNCNDGDTFGGTCENVSRQDSLYGWQGYCIEYDTTIQLNGDSGDDGRACLTWIPVDQLEGATNLYAKFEEAGFELENNYFCAEVGETFTVGTTGVACAEWVTNCKSHTDTLADFKAALSDSSNNYECLGNVSCPNGFMAIMTGCYDRAYPGNTGDGAEHDNLCADGDSSDDSDCPFFCIPDPNGLELDNEEIVVYYDANGDGVIDEEDLDDTGSYEVCDGPADMGWDVEETYSSLGGRATSYGTSYTFTTKLLNQRHFDNAFEYYENCIAVGLSRTQLEEMYEPYNSPEEATLGFTGPSTSATFYPLSAQESEGGSRGFPDFDYSNTTNVSCESIVQVSQESDSDGNKAFTNRTWSGSSYSIDSDTGSSKFGYDIDTVPHYYGLTIDLQTINESLVPVPIVPYMCRQNSGDDYSDRGMRMYYTPDDAVCDSNTNDSEQAQVFRNVLLGINESQEQGSSGYAVVCDWADDPTACESNGYCTASSSDPYPSECNAGISCESGYCDGGPRDGLECPAGDSDCQVVECFDYSVTFDTGSGESTVFYDYCGLPVGEYEVTRWDTVDESVERMNQIFAASYGLLEFQGWAAYAPGRDVDYYDDATEGEWTWDITDGSGDYEPVPPVVSSLGECFGSECLEGEENRITLNGTDSSSISGAGTLNVSANFYAYANEDQMPIRTIIVDWGDGDEYTDINDWPTDGQYGSSSGDNRYKNHRGLEKYGSTIRQICDDDYAYHFGESEDACSGSYLTFNNDYVCSQRFLDDMKSVDGIGRECDLDPETGNLVNSPCYGGPIVGASEDTCVFQPRVFVQDNWGWCASSNPVCDAGDDYSEEYCYGGSALSEDECDYENCPGDGCGGRSGSIADPWVYFEGFVIVESE